MLANDEPEDKPEADADLMADVFDEIKSAADDMDAGRLQEIFAELDDYKIPDDFAKLWAALKAAADKFDYDTLSDLLSRNKNLGDD